MSQSKVYRPVADLINFLTWPALEAFQIVLFAEQSLRQGGGDRVAMLCLFEEFVVETNRRYRGLIIGWGGANLSQSRTLLQLQGQVTQGNNANRAVIFHHRKPPH